MRLIFFYFFADLKTFCGFNSEGLKPSLIQNHRELSNIIVFCDHVGFLGGCSIIRVTKNNFREVLAETFGLTNANIWYGTGAVHGRESGFVGEIRLSHDYTINCFISFLIFSNYC